MSSRSGGGGPPPPPGRSAGGGPPPPPTRDNKPPVSAVSEERGDLLASIRAGMQLKKVSSEESARGGSPPAADVGLDGMAGALARALAQRSNVIQHSGER